MSRRSSNSRPPRSNQASDPVATVDHPEAEKTPKPSLESLLASCGALQSVVKHAENSDVFNEEVATGNNFEVTPSIADEPQHAETRSAVSPSEPESFGASNEWSSESPGWIDELRHEFRASIDELKATQSAASASQSAVLKTLTEIIFQSSAGRDGSDGGLDKKLTELEDRIINRICKFGELTNVAEVRKSSTAPNAAEPAKKNSERSWAEIRNDLVTHGESGFEYDRIEGCVTDSESTGEGSETSEVELIVDVPEAIDPETLSEQELRVVFHEREEFIAKLIGRLRHQYQRSSGHLPADQLKHMAEHLPQELAAQVLQTLQQLNELARVGELELSLERARLARQVNQLDHSRQLIEHNARQIGLTLEEDGTVSNPQKLTLRNSGSRRWLSKLGFGL